MHAKNVKPPLLATVGDRFHVHVLIYMNVMYLNIYITPLQGIYSEALSARAYMMLNVITNEYITSVSKTMHSKLKESPVAGPRTHVEPTNGFPSTAEDGMDVQSLWTKLRR